MKPLTLLLATLCLTLGLISSTSAASLIEWNTFGYVESAGGMPPQTSSYAVVADGVNAGELQLHGTTLTDGPQDFFVLANWSSSVAQNNLSASNYISFTLAPDPGSQITFDSIEFSTRTSSGAANPKSGLWAYRIDGGDWQVAYTWTLTTSSYNSGNIPSFDLGFTTDKSVEFGLWLYGGNNATGSARVINSVDGGDYPGLTVHGSVSPVPEPSAVLLLGVGLSVIVFARRRFAKVRVA
ncbi:MAG: PEP-CTERM sorting domain-containing protein [Cupriavidus sp.]|nr:MAG: PEP-CTERM sorting domain-containing protein [Cupriavidus sp.]